MISAVPQLFIRQRYHINISFTAVFRKKLFSDATGLNLSQSES